MKPTYTDSGYGMTFSCSALSVRGDELKVKNESGTVIDTIHMTPIPESKPCKQTFVATLPSAKFYEFVYGDDDKGPTYSAADLKKDGYAVDMTR
jgi:hypothetical protein